MLSTLITRRSQSFLPTLIDNELTYSPKKKYPAGHPKAETRYFTLTPNFDAIPGTK